MRKSASILCVSILTSTSFCPIGAAGAQTLNVGLTIMPAHSLARPDSLARKANSNTNGHTRIIEYFSPDYEGSRQKLRQQNARRSVAASVVAQSTAGLSYR